jgi:hypothetical protein
MAGAMKFEDLPDILTNKWTTVRATKNVLSPLQWFMWPLTLACILGIVYAPEYRRDFVYAMLFFIAYFLVFFAIFAFRDPNRLQSEDHTQKMTWLTRMQDNRGPLVDVTPTSNVAVGTATAVGIQNPAPTPGGTP